MSFPYSHAFHFFFLLLSFMTENCNFEIPEQSRDTSSLVDYSFKSFELKPLRSKFDMKTLIPKHIQLYMAAAFSEKDFPSFSKMFNKTLSSIPNNFLITDSLNRQYKVSVSPLFFVLPDSGRFSSSIYEVMCNSFDRKRVAAILVIGENPAAFTVSLAAVTSNIPVLWARGGDINPPGSLEQQTSLEIRLEPGEIQLFEAIRGVFLATHWHSFTVMAMPSLAARCASILASPPLNPTVVSFTRNPHTIFRKLADVSRSTRGVVLLLCDVSDAILIMDVAKRLNMIDGHFVWIWIDTTTKPASFLTLPTSRSQNLTQKIANYLDKSKKFKKSKSDFLFQSDGSKLSDLNASNENHDRHLSYIKKSLRKQVMRSKRMVSNDNYYWKRKNRKYSESSNLREITAGEGRRTVIATKSPNENSQINNTSDNAKNNNVESENETSSFLTRGMIKAEISNDNNGTNLVDSVKSKTANKAQEIAKKYMELKNSEGEFGKLKVKSLETEKFAVADYLNDFAMQLDQSFDEGEDEEENEKEESLVNRAWGKILEKFPIKPPDVKDEEKEPKDTNLPIGLLSIKPESVKLDRYLVKGSVRLLVSSLHSVLKKSADWLSALDSATSCWIKPSSSNKNFSESYAREIRKAVQESLSGKLQFQEGDRADRALLANFQILNLVPEKFNINFYNDINFIEDAILYWRQVGKVTGQNAHLDTIVWPGGDLVASALSAKTRSVFRIVTALAPPFVMEGALDEDGQCLRGVICYRVLNSDKDNLTLVFNEMDTQERLEDEAKEFGGDDTTEKPFRFIDHAFLEYYSTKYKYKSSCCYGLAMDLLENIAQELEFEFHLYITPDGAYGAKNHVWEQGGPRYKWNGIVGDLVSGAAHMSFAALSVSKQRSQVIDFSTPYFFSGVSFLAAPTQKSEIPLLAFLLPFSPELWIAIFTSLNITAMAVACYEWLSPFGLNPWGRQRSRNFSIASALWVMWGLLCGHLVAFKAPKSWPNKFLINVWGGFSVIFVASYTANIAALIAGLFFHNSVSDYHDRSLLSQRVGAPKSSAADYYIHRANQHLWEHMQKYSFKDIETGIALLRNGSLDILIADTPILDYYRATDHGCKLQKIVEAINDDTYAIGMNKGFPLKESISAVISKYSNNGYMDILTEKWYGGLPCFKMTPSVELTDVGQPRPLGVAAVAGVFLLLGLGVVVGVLILIIEHLFYRYTLPILRHQPKGTIWRSRNIMFFSQKLYRFINCVELVSPHHAARELVHTLRQGQITSLFQKSVKRKEHEQRRRRKSKAQFFEMIQEIRRVQQEEKDEPRQSDSFGEKSESPKSPLRSFLTSPRSLKNFCNTKISVSPQISVDSGEILSFYESNQHTRSSSKSPSRLDIRRFSKELFSLPKSPKTKSSTSLDIRRFSSDLDDKKNKNDLRISKTDVRLSAKDIRIQTSNAIGRRLSKDTTSWLINSPPDLNSRRKSHLDIANAKSLSVSENILDDSTKSSNDFNTTKFFTVGPSKSNEYNKELLSKSMTLTPVISKAATLRLASSGGLEVPKPVKSRPRLPSPPPSPVIDFRNSKTPKISVSDTSYDGFNVYDTILPQKEELLSHKTTVRNSHSRSKSLDGKHLNFTATVINIENMDGQKNNLKNERQTVNYATLEHKRNNFETEIDKSKNVNEKFAKHQNSSTVKEKQALNEGRGPISKNVPLPVIEVKKTPAKDSKTLWNNTKEETKNVFDKGRQVPSPKIDNLKVTEVRPEVEEVTYAEPQKLKKEKKEREVQHQQQITPTRKPQVEIKFSKPDTPNKPKIPPKSNALKQMQARVYSAPDSTCRQTPATILFIPEETFKKKNMAECNYYPDRKIFQRSQTEPPRYERCTERCFQTFPSNRLCPYMSIPEPHRSKSDADRRFATTGRSNSVPEQKFFISPESGCRNDDCYRRRRTDSAVVVLQHSSRSLDTPSKNPGILKNRRRSKSRDCDELPPAPPSPPERNRNRYERSEAQSNREILLTIKRHSQGYKEPP